MATDAPTDRVTHLVRRCGFGAPEGDLRELADRDLHSVIDGLIWAAPEPDPTPDEFPAPSAQLDGGNWMGDRLVAHWVKRMANTGAPVPERLTWFWHQHFATSRDKVGADRLMWEQNRMLRALGRGSFADLLWGVVFDPAMGRYLDLLNQPPGAPNENFARELLELFTLGTGTGATHLPHYTQTDVGGAAVALTGLTLRDIDRDTRATFDPSSWAGQRVQILGRSGRLRPDDVVELVCGHPEVPRHLARRMWAHFCGGTVDGHDAPAEGAVEDVAQAAGTGLDLAAMFRTLFAHPGFAEAARHPQVTEPVPWFVGAVRALRLGATVDTWVVWHLARMRQHPFHPPGVAGWPRGRSWLSTDVCAGRVIAARDLAWRFVESDDTGATDLLSGPGPVRSLLGRMGITRPRNPELVQALERRSRTWIQADTTSGLARTVALVLCSEEVVLA